MDDMMIYAVRHVSVVGLVGVGVGVKLFELSWSFFDFDFTSNHASWAVQCATTYVNPMAMGQDQELEGPTQNPRPPSLLPATLHWHGATHGESRIL